MVFYIIMSLIYHKLPTKPDMEGIGGPPLGPEEMLDAIYYAVCTLKQQLTSHLSYAKIIWTADTGPYFPYDNLTADGCVDLWIDMVCIIT